MGKPKLFVLATAVLALLAAAPMLSTAAAAPVSGHVHTATSPSPQVGSAADMPMAKAYATKAAPDAATAEVKKVYGDRLPNAVTATGQCMGSWIYLTTTLGYSDHADANPAYIMGYLSAGYAPCRTLTLGGQYAGCGISNGNGWILIPDIYGFHGPIW